MLELFYTALMIGFGWHLAALAMFSLTYIVSFIIGFVTILIKSLNNRIE